MGGNLIVVPSEIIVSSLEYRLSSLQYQGHKAMGTESANKVIIKGIKKILAGC